MPASPADSRKATNALVSLPLSFEKNAGQTDSKVKFLSRGTGYTLFLTQEETVLALRQRAESARCSDAAFGHAARSNSAKPASSCAEKGAAGLQTGQQARELESVLSMKLVGASSEATIAGMEELSGHSNYLVGNDPKKWHTNVPTYAKVQYRGIYPGVDLVYYGNQRALEYDFVVAPGADTRAIQLDVRGAENMRVNADGDLVLATAVGEVYLKTPGVYQKQGEEKKEIAANYAIQDGHLVSFELGPYDHAQPLVIDPTVIFSTFLGGSTTFGDFGHNVALDLQQAIYIAGQTGSTDFPTTTGSFQPKSSGFATTQPFITKIKPDGSALVYSTFVTGTDNNFSLDFASGLGVDASGSAWITGATNATDFPLMNPIQSSIGGARGQGCAFLSKLTPDGSGLLFSTYFCGRDVGDNTQALSLALDPSGNPTIAGFTNSVHLPLLNPLQATLNGTQNAFVAKFTSAGALVFSTYVGGNGTDQAEGVALDANGNAYITGFTTSTNFPTMNPFQGALAPGVTTGTTAFQNAFVSEIKADGSAFLYSTYLGGNNSNATGEGANGESGFGIAVPAPGTAVVVGQTNSNNFPTVTPIQAQYGGGGLDGFVTEILTTATSPGTPPVFSTFVGGSGDDFLLGVALDAAGNIYFSGGTSSRDLATVNPLQGVLSGQSDVLIGRMKAIGANGSAFDYLTYIGLSDFSNAVGIAVDNGTPVNAYITGTTNSPSFPTVSTLPTVGPLQPNLLTGFNFQGNQASTAFLAKVSSAQSTGVTFFPPNGNFGSVNVASTIQGPGTITNNSPGSITILSYVFTGTNGSDFAPSASVPADTCVLNSVPLPAGQSCVKHFAFTPGAEGTRTGLLTVTFNSAGVNQTLSVPVTGVGVLPAVSINPANLDFGDVPLGGNQGFQTGSVTITNEGGGPLTVGNVHVIGPDAASFSASFFGCAPVPPSQACGVSVGFTPLTVKTYSAILEIDDNAPGSPQMVPITGNGVSQITFPSAIGFGTVALGSANGAPALAQLANGTASQLAISTVTITGTNAGDFSITLPQPAFAEQCQAGAVVPPLGAVCEVNLVFKPTGTGLRTATLTLTDNGAGSPRIATLTGIGSNAVQVFPNPLNFGPVVLGHQGLSTLFLQDDAPTAVSVTQLTITGPNAADFSINGSPTCQAPANGGFCFLTLSFIPTVLAGPSNTMETATLTITYMGAPGSPITVPLQGSGIANFGFGISGVFLLNSSLSSGGLDFGGQLLNETSVPPMVLNFFNQEPTPLTIGTLTLNGANPGDFSIVASPEDCAAGEVLGAGGTCAIHVTFTAAAMGGRSANLSVTYTGQAGSPATATLVGMGVPPAIMVSDTILDFGQQVVNTPPTTQTVFLLNGNVPLLTLGMNTVPAVTLTPVNPSVNSPFSVVTTGVPAMTCITGMSLAGSGGSCAVVVTYTPTALGTQTATLSIADSDPGSPRTVTVTGTGINSPAFASFNPASLTFSTQTTGTTSAPQTTFLSVSSNVTIASTNGVFIAGPNASDFAIVPPVTGNCTNGLTVIPDGGCSVSVTFTPTALGMRTATLTVIDDASQPVQSVTLTGTGVSAAITVTPSPLNYGMVLFENVPQPPPQPLTLINGMGLAITFVSAPITGPNMLDFAVDPSSTCIVNPTVAANGGSCTIIPTFSPTVNGPETATITVNATLAGSPLLPIPVTLNATGLSQITLNPTALNFGNVSLATASPRSLSLTVTNNTANRLLIPNASDSITGPNMTDFAITSDTCSTPVGTAPLVLPTGGVCSVTVTFTLGGSGNRTATLNIGAGGTLPLPVTVPLSGTGTAPVASLNPTSLTFANQAVSTTSGALPITLTNTGTENLSLGKFVFTGAANQDYAIDSTSTCPFPGVPRTGKESPSLAPGASCVLSINFTPSVAGTRSATITITDNNNGVANSTQSIPLSGTGATPGPTASLNPTSLTFAAQQVNTTSAAQGVTVTNTGGANLVLGATPVAIGGANAGDFATAAGTTCTANLPIAPNASCLINITFHPTLGGSRTATLTITDNSGGTMGATQTVPLSGTGNVSGATASLNPTSLTFAAQTVGATSAALSVTVTSTGQVDLVLGTTPLTISGSNAGDFKIATGTTCTASLDLPVDNSCVINITFTPGAAGSRAATLTITDNSGGSAGATQTVPLTGTGTGADFTVTGPTAPVVVKPGQLAVFPITVTPGPNGFSGTITFCALAVAPATCFPNGVAAEFPQPTQTPNGNSVTTTLWVFTTGPGSGSVGAAPVSYNRPVPPSARWYAMLGLFSVMMFLAWVVTQWRGRKLPRFGFLVPALAVVFAVIAFTGCGGGSSGSNSTAANFTPAGTFQVLIQATSGTTVRTTTVTVQVQ